MLFYRRGRLADELVEAVRQERYEDASSIQLELEAATMGRADITQVRSSAATQHTHTHTHTHTLPF